MIVDCQDDGDGPSVALVVVCFLAGKTALDDYALGADCQAWTKRRTQIQGRIKIQQAFILKLQATRQSDNQIGYRT